MSIDMERPARYRKARTRFQRQFISGGLDEVFTGQDVRHRPISKGSRVMTAARVWSMRVLSMAARSSGTTGITESDGGEPWSGQ